MTLLVFTRPFKSLSRITTLYSQANDGETLFISDFSKCGDLPLVEFQHKKISQKVKARISSEIDYEEVIGRDRWLAFEKVELATNLVSLAWEFLDEVFTQHRFSLYIGIPTDNYICHLTILACRKYGVPYLVPDYFSVPGYIRFWDVDNRVIVRKVDDAEAQEVITKLNAPKFRPDWLSDTRSPRALLKLLLKEKARKIVFECFKRIPSRRYTFHYNCIYPLGSNYVSRGLDSLFVRKKFTSDLEGVRATTARYRNIAYLPLQFAPESSLNYAIPSHHFAVYKTVITKLVESLPDDTFLLVKEHPDFYGLRDPKFYSIFDGRENIALVDIGCSTSDLFDLSNVLITTGCSSTGIEGVVKGQHVISLGGGYYGSGGHISCIHNLEEMESQLPALLETRLSTDENRSITFIRFALESTLKGIYDYEYKTQTDDSLHLITISKILELGRRGSTTSEPMVNGENQLYS